MGSGPIEDGLTNGILVINYEASMNTIVSKRVVYKLLQFINDVGGFSSIILLLNSLIVLAWNSWQLQFFLVGAIFLKKAST
jgi:hypothetical protein